MMYQKSKIKRNGKQFHLLLRLEELIMMKQLFCQIDIEKLGEVIREHWNIEGGLYWKLDVILDEDSFPNRINNSINNLSIMRKIVFNLVSLDNSFEKVPLQRKLTRYMFDFNNIEKLILGMISNIS